MTDTVKVTGAPTSYNVNFTYAEGAAARQEAVAAVLELFHAQAAAGKLTPSQRDDAFSNLSKYADQIEDALRKSN